MTNIGFLLGSGASLSAGMPTMGHITERILHGTGLYRYSDGTYHIGQVPDIVRRETEEYLEPVRRFLMLLKRHAERYYSATERSVNYEDLHFLARQTNETLVFEYENPAVLPFIEDLESDPALLQPAPGATIRTEWTLPGLATETTNYIHDMVTAMLAKSPERRDHLSFVVDGCGDASFSSIGLFTLNHDTVLEAVCREHGLEFVDGFGKTFKGVRYFHPSLFDATRGAVPLLKLHGAIDWYRLRPDEGDWTEDRVGIIEDPDWYHTQTPDGRLQIPMDARPMILIGTFNKVLEYTAWMFSELFY